VAAAATAAVLAVNLARFADTTPVIRTKQFDFLPAPEVARVLACGHHGTAAKLRWIDSFAWFQWQLDHPGSVREVGGVSAMKRLYDTLIALDPRFEPFYLHANLNLSGVLQRREEAVALLARGTHELPRSMDLWRNLVSELVVNFKLEERQPHQLAGLLDAWAAAVPPDERGQIWQWRQALARRKALGVDQIGYWLDRIQETPPGSPYEAFLVEAAREAMARLAVERLSPLIAAAGPGADAGSLADPALLARVHPRGIPAGLPIRDGRLLPDPWWHPWRITASGAVSVGWERIRIERRLPGTNQAIAERAKRDGRQPTDLAEAIAWAGLPAHPSDGTWTWDGRALGVSWTPAPEPAWQPDRARR
jgi:hypothetical protein